MTRLSEANTSREIELSQYFRPWSPKKDLLVLVEGDEDVFFWEQILQYAQNRYARINVCTLKLPDATNPGNDVDRKGKESLMALTNLGPSKIIAIDMDYDNIVSGYHSYSARIGNDPFVLHTIYYSMENHKLYPDIIKNYITDNFGKAPTFDFESRISEFSATISEYLLLVIVHERKRVARLLTPQEETRLTISEFRRDVSTFKFSKDCFAENAHEWQNHMQQKYHDLLNKYQTDIQNLRSELALIGYTPETYWKLLQGHTLAGYVLRCVTSVSTAIEKEKEKELINSLPDKSKAPQAIKDYRRQIGIGDRKMHEFINQIFIEKPILSDNDPGINLIQQQIDSLPH